MSNERALFDIEEKQSNNAAAPFFSAKSNEWYTPAIYADAARELMDGIELDPASCEEANRVIKAERYFTIYDRALSQDWTARSVWLNPPYGGEQSKFIARLIREFQTGTIGHAMLLVNSSTDRRWFQWLWEYEICFTDHRVPFYSPGGKHGQPAHGNSFVYFGEQTEKFRNIFRQFGPIVKKVA